MLDKRLLFLEASRLPKMLLRLLLMETPKKRTSLEPRHLHLRFALTRHRRQTAENLDGKGVTGGTGGQESGKTDKNKGFETKRNFGGEATCRWY